MHELAVQGSYAVMLNDPTLWGIESSMKKSRVITQDDVEAEELPRPLL